MRLDQALAKIGATIVKQQSGHHRVILFIRASLDDVNFARWKRVIEEFLLTSVEKRNKSRWSVDISRAYFVTENRAVKYLWRVVMSGDVPAAAEAFAQAVVRGVAQGTQVKSFPLVGRVDYPFNPAEGKMKGGHSPSVAAKARSVGIGSVE